MGRLMEGMMDRKITIDDSLSAVIEEDSVTIQLWGADAVQMTVVEFLDLAARVRKAVTKVGA